MRIGVFHQSYQSEERLLESFTKRAWMGAFIVVLIAFPLLAGDYVMAITCIIGIHVVATLGLNITTGNAGLISLSHAAFLGVGCYVTAWMSRWGVPFFLALPIAGLVTAAIGIVVGLPSLRVKGLYLAIATLAAHFVLTFIFREWTPVTGGMNGVTVVRPNLFGFELSGDRRMFYLIAGCALLLGLAAANLKRTYWGRAFIAGGIATSQPRSSASTC